MSDDRLTDEERGQLDAEGGRWNRDSMYLCVESILAARTAALIDRAERAEREYAEAAFAVTQLAAIRAAVTGLADEWDAQWSRYPDRVNLGWAANQVRALLTDEGDNQ